MVIVRPESKADEASVFQINESAFGSPGEAKLVDALRPIASPQISLVAALDGDVVGHIFFSPVEVGSGPRAIALAPVAVAPEQQNRGIGSLLVREGLERCREIDEPLVFVLGHTTYYPRFGFRVAHEHGLYYREPGPNPAFMFTELEPGALAGRSGQVRYLPPFEAVDG